MILRAALLAVIASLGQDAWRTERMDVAIPMRDGASLAADLYLPPKAGRYPVVLIQTPYNKKHLGTPLAGVDAPVAETGRGAHADVLGLLDREHYVYCVLDWRGFHASRKAAAGHDRRGWRRGMDGYDAVEWLAAQDFCDGKVGTWGGSALGKQQFDTAAEKPPHLVCAVPLIAAMGQAYDAYYEGGVPLEAHLERLEQLGFGSMDVARDHPDAGDPVWKAATALTRRPQAIDVPCLMITGWWDNYPDAVIRFFEDLVAKGGAAAREHSRLLVGPWDHVSVGLAKQGQLEFPRAAGESAVAAGAFFDRWLRGIDNGWDRTPRVRYWVCGEERWAGAASWSGVARGATTLQLRADGTLGAEPGAAGSRAYLHDPMQPAPDLGGANLPPMKHGPTDHSALDGRGDTLAWSTGPLGAPLAINGAVEVAIAFAADRESADLVARLCEVRADGKPYLLGTAALRVAGLQPGKPAGAVVKLPPIAAVVPKGGGLRLYVGSASFPRYGRNPHTGAKAWDAKTALKLNLEIRSPGSTLKVPTPAE